VRDTLKIPAVWHYVIQRIGCVDVICCSQSPTEKAAIVAAKKELRSLNKKNAADLWRTKLTHYRSSGSVDILSSTLLGPDLMLR